MRRRGWTAAMLLVTACASGSDDMRERPDWTGPPLAVTSGVDGSVRLELQAPSAGHAFELRAVVVAGETADVQVVHRTPGDAFVARVITPLAFVVPAERLGDCGRIRVWITTLEGAADRREPAPQLAFVLQRP